MVLSVRIVNIDSYMNAPIAGLDVVYSEFRGTAVNQVPILRLFGCTEKGEKICVHIHGVFPYLYIPYDGSTDASVLMYQIANSIDKSVNISLNQASSSIQHVYKIVLISGIPMYGYHSRCHQFFKIYLYNPLLIKRVSALLMNEATLGKLYQPHETHLNYVLQFMIDYNLHGMSNALFSEFKYRNNKNTDIFVPDLIEKMTVCKLEADVLAENIINRLEVSSGKIGTNPGIEALWNDERQRRRNKGDTSQIPHLLELERVNVEPCRSHILFKQALLERMAALSGEKSSENSLNLSVYPAETPSTLSLPNASQHESQNVSSLEMSLNETLFNETIQDQTLDEDALKLLEVLNQLNESNNKDEDDCILTQLTEKKDEDEVEFDTDLSMPLECVTTPKKIQNLDEIPQLDGVNDSDSNSNKKLIKKKTRRSVHNYSPLPITIVKTNKLDSTMVEESIVCKYKPEKNVTNTELTAAQRYDLTHNYKAKEGTSSILTPVEESDNCPSSSPSVCLSLTPIDNEESADRLITLRPIKKAPTKLEIINTLNKYDIPNVRHPEPFYGNVKDVTLGTEIGLRYLKIPSKTTLDLPDFELKIDALNNYRKTYLNILHPNINLKKSTIDNFMLSYCNDKHCLLMPIAKAPTRKDVMQWVQKCEKSKKIKDEQKQENKTRILIPLSQDKNDNDIELSLSLTPDVSQNSRPESPVFPKKKRNFESQITGVSINNTFGFKQSLDDYQQARAVIENQFLTLMFIELHISTRGELKPDPNYDEINAIFYTIFNDIPGEQTRFKGVIISDKGRKFHSSHDVVYAENEIDLLDKFCEILRKFDPDIVGGYEIEMLSWGYLIERAKIIGINIKPRLGRMLNEKIKNEDMELKLTGRIVLDVWRLMRYEIALQSYTFESVVYNILQKRIPFYSFRTLTSWWEHYTNLYRHRVIDYYFLRVDTLLELFDKLDFIGRTSELARLFGILFYEVLSRGSQFRVESMMLRLAKPLNFIPVSPSVQQRAHMKAPEYIALVLEPESKLYNDPVIVLDFQSLYPSLIIAYNYCFTTCIGRVECLGRDVPFQFGTTQLKVSRRKVEKLLKKDLLNFSPCGVAFVKKSVRDGILPRMLREILDTRLMVKNAMKENKNDRLLQKVLHNRQLGLKLIANVTYGYTSANYSGRMPSVEIADSVVSKGRETLQRAIEMVDSTPEWGARVVYGDTDSLFVLVPGKSRQDAFEVGKKIANAVTNANPDPMKLKLEKVYQPCILQTKKRYVGYMYESADQKDPVYEAKGIETVRRDGCPAVSKMLEKCLRILFETKNVSEVKAYVQRQFSKIHSNRASIQDLTFAKEYRGASGYRPTACVPALELARRWTAIDKRNEPRSGERVPYIIINGPPGLPLIKLVRSPRDLLNDPSLRPNAIYYITRVIVPPINRCFNLIGADLQTWYNQMSRKTYQALPNSISPGKKSTISQYFTMVNCVTCNEQTQNGICEKCREKPQKTTILLMEKLQLWERNEQQINLICQTCTTCFEPKCESLDCPVLYRRVQTSRDAQQTTYLRQLLAQDEIF